MIQSIVSYLYHSHDIALAASGLLLILEFHLPKPHQLRFPNQPPCCFSVTGVVVRVAVIGKGSQAKPESARLASHLQAMILASYIM